MTAGQPLLAEAFVDDFLGDPDWQAAAGRFNWRVQRPSPLTVIVTLDARPHNGVVDTFTLRLQAEFCPALPPDVRFVNPDTLAYDVTVDTRHVAVLTASWCYTHTNYSYPTAYEYAPQLVCNSLSHGYYVSNHTPTPDQRWDPTRHSIGTSIEVVHRALRSSHYNGRHP